MRYFIKNAAIKLYSLHVYLIAIILLIFLGPFVFISLFFKPLKQGNFIYKACHIYAKVWFFIVGINYIEINKPKDLSASQFIFIANHTSYLDVLCMLSAVNQPVRPLGKKEMAAYPIFGYFYKKVVVNVDRSNISMRVQSITTLKKYIAQKISIFIFPEGTFNETEKPLKSFYDGAFLIAIDTQTPIKPMLFLDNNKRMNSSGSFNVTPGKCRTLFLDEISVINLKRSDLEQLKQKVFDVMEKKLLENNFKN